MRTREAMLDTGKAVRARYSAAAERRQPGLCCPVSYDPRYLAVIPQEVLERDYGCGDPTPFVQPGDTVLDLGSGAGKICFIAAQIAGAKGKVIGIDSTPEMLALARKHQPAVARRLGFNNVRFCRARIQDLALSLDEADAYLAARPVRTAAELTEFENFRRRLRQSAPVVPDESVDIILSNCVLNLVAETDREKLFAGMHRVLKRGGRAAISDIVADEDVPEALKRDPELWSGCLAGAFREDKFLEAFEQARFYGIEIARRDAKPWQTVRGIEFRSVTVTARKGKEGPCLERSQAVIYKGPWKEVLDDDGHRLRRGQRMAVCDKTYNLLTRAPYAESIIPVPPLKAVARRRPAPFACKGAAVRDPRETKGRLYRKTLKAAANGCGPAGCC